MKTPTHKIVCLYPDERMYTEHCTSEYQAIHFSVRLKEHEERRLKAGVITEMAKIWVEEL